MTYLLLINLSMLPPLLFAWQYYDTVSLAYSYGGYRCRVPLNLFVALILMFSLVSFFLMGYFDALNFIYLAQFQVKLSLLYYDKYKKAMLFNTVSILVAGITSIILMVSTVYKSKKYADSNDGK